MSLEELIDSSHILVISDSFHTLPEAVAILADSRHQVSYVRDLAPWQNLSPLDAQALANATAIVMGRVMGVDAKQLALALKLRVIALHTSGSDNVDVVEATRRGIVVTTVKGVNAEQCAEFAMGLLLSVVRQIRIGDRAIRAGLWATKTQASLDVYGATLGVIGFGQIAQAFIRRARSFGLRILVHTRTPNLAIAQQLGVEYVSLDEVLSRSDIVSLFASLTSASRRMIGDRELRLMKRTAYLINIGRGELLDEEALVNALQEGRIAGAGLDVFEEEPLLASPLFALENVVLTPHQAGLTHHGKSGAAIRAARNALSAIDGVCPADAINPDAWTTSNTCAI